ncbi:MAG: type II toxin-antitoxin system PemK/MazF family toxin [Hyphomicrobium sp.]|nr:type II toxin-antitoxin system PemK/MazF family toxin [Hyphomicrobium sp.]
MRRGEIWWAELGDPSGSEAGFRRPVLIVSGNDINESRLKTVLTVPLTSNLSREHFDFSLRIPANAAGLRKPSVALLNLITTTNRLVLTEQAGRVPDDIMAKVDDRLKLVLGLGG